MAGGVALVHIGAYRFQRHHQPPAHPDRPDRVGIDEAAHRPRTDLAQLAGAFRQVEQEGVGHGGEPPADGQGPPPSHASRSPWLSGGDGAATSLAERGLL
jgi:hypothetical protein